MKTKYIVLSIVLVALTTTSFAQLSAIKERLVSKKQSQVELRPADYSTGNSSIERWMHGIQDWANERFTRDIYEGPVITRTICSDQVEILYDEEIKLENWMETPFDKGLSEEILTLEPWMSVPFENHLVDEVMTLEQWMTTPFDAVEDIEVESWMTSSWL